MAKMGSIRDTYPQFMRLTVTTSAANTLTFGKLSVGGGLFQYAGFLLCRIEYTIRKAAIELMTASGDRIEVAICGSDTIDTIDLERPEVYDRSSLVRLDFGTAGSAELVEMPIIRDFTTMPGGGQLVPAQDVYIATASVGLGDVHTVDARVWYRVIELKAEDYLEIAQRLRILST